MTDFDLVVSGGRVVLDDRVVPAEIGIRGDRIAAVAETGTLAGARTLDAAGAIVLPGGIDPHVHTRWPFLQATTEDDFFLSTRAAAYGGTTTILDSVIRRSPASVSDAIAGRRAQADGDAVLDYALHCAVGDPDDFDPAGIGPAVADAGVGAIKLYLAYKARGIMTTDGLMLRVMEAAAAAGAIVKVHAENGLIADANVERFYADGHTTAEWFPRTKPAWVEAEAIARACTIARKTGTALYVVHVSSAAGLAEIVRARALGATVIAETCPQYLLLDESVFARPDGHRFLCSPPIRSAADQEALWAGIADGTIDTVGSDHCVFLTHQKDEHRNDFARVPNGLPGVETRLPLIVSEGTRRGIALPRLAAVLSTNVARTFGLYPQKGAIAPGSDADLVLWDPGATWTIESDRLHMGCDWTPYEGMTVTGRPRTVVVRGRVTVAGDEFLGERGAGRYLSARPRSASTAS